jgi:hypothetical protein
METQKRKADGIVHMIAGKVSSPAGYSKKNYLFINFLLSSIIALIRLYRGV